MGAIILINTNRVQVLLSDVLSDNLSKVLQTEVSIKKVDLGLFNRIVLDDIDIKDKEQLDLVHISRLSARLNVSSLFKGKISIRSVQLFGFKANLYKESIDSKANYQFLVDLLQPQEESTDSNLDLRINSIIIRRGKFSYNLLSAPETPKRLNVNHLSVNDITAIVSVKAIRKDSLNIKIKRFNFKEQSGLALNNLKMKLLANNNKLEVNDFNLKMPNSMIDIPLINVEYDSIAQLTKNPQLVSFDAETDHSYLSLQDFSALDSSFEPLNHKIDLKFNIKGKANSIHCKRIEISNPELLDFVGYCEVNNIFKDKKKSNIFVEIQQFNAYDRFIRAIENSELLNLGDFKLTELNSFNSKGRIASDLGKKITASIDVTTNLGDIKFSGFVNTNNLESKRFKVNGDVTTDNLNVGAILPKLNLGIITSKIHLDGMYHKTYDSKLNLEVTSPLIEYNKYAYNNLFIKGSYINGNLKGNVSLNDKNAQVFIRGDYQTKNKKKALNLYALFNHINLHKLNILKNEDKKEDHFSLVTRLNLKGTTINKMFGKINIDNISYYNNKVGKTSKYDKVDVTVRSNKMHKSINIASNALQLNLYGNYSYQTLPYTFTSLVDKHFSALNVKVPKTYVPNQLQFDATLNDLSFLDILGIKLETEKSIHLKGSLDDEKDKISLNVLFPKIKYNDKQIESGQLTCLADTSGITSYVRFNNKLKKDNFSIALESSLKNNQLNTILHWGNTALQTYSGEVKANASFYRLGKSKGLNTVVKLEKTHVILNDSVWNLNPATLIVNPEKIMIRNFNFEHKDQHLKVHGIISDVPSDTLHMNLNKMDLGYIFALTNLKRSVDFKGKATGEAFIAGTSKDPIIKTKLFVKDYSFNDAILGDMNIRGEWVNLRKGIYLDALINERDIASTRVDGYIFPLKPNDGLDLTFHANNTNIGFLEYYLSSIFPSVKGRAKGDIRVHGTFRDLNITGKAMTNAALKVGVLNTTFNIADTIYLNKRDIQFRNFAIKDIHGNKGSLNGRLQHNHLRDLKFNFDITTNKMLVLDLKESPEMPFYGNVYASGKALLKGDSNGLDVNAAMTCEDKSNFVYPLSVTSTSAYNEFVKFNDVTPRRNVDLLFDEPKDKKKESSTESDIRLNLSIDISPKANIKVIMDNESGDYIATNGSGNIRTEFYNKGDIRLFGNYRINKGVYKFSLQNVIKKDFRILDGGNVIFNGNPENTNVDVQAQYTVNSVPLSDLGTEVSGLVTQHNVRVNCLMNLSGALSKPSIKLNIELPNESQEVQNMVKNYISTEEQMNMQILYLLGIGKFYTANNDNQDSNMVSSVLSSTLSGQLNNMLSQIINNNNWNVGTSFRTGNKGWTDMEVEGILSGQLLNNRLLINGNFGYKENPMSTTNFVGDFDVRWLLNRSGSFILKAYNETNDRYYIRSSQTTQGIGLIYKKEFSKWSEMFFWNKWFLRKREPKLKTEQ